ncbi:acyl-CoA thioesterase [Paucibacter sp. M5-1]|uniref:acyl-CoA thioesterase n=1 Tax=Paucibacter sp. M5-1 TaxID=3015998 RepID=UPI0022B93A87|nr:thioesterase family protein [Paucibacter sp. M5-1]MCZ7880079.1 thioesterase family protein [Paucibacter sp. M5-1]
MTQALLSYRGAVYPWHCDHIGHMNVMWYVGKFDEATWNAFHQIGLTPSYLRDSGRGMAAVEQHIQYLREVHAGAVLSIRTTVSEIRDKVVVLQHEMSNDDTGEIAARMTLTGVHLDTVKRKACAFSSQILEAVKPLLGKD